MIALTLVSVAVVPLDAQTTSTSTSPSDAASLYHQALDLIPAESRFIDPDFWDLYPPGDRADQLEKATEPVAELVHRANSTEKCDLYGGWKADRSEIIVLIGVMRFRAWWHLSKQRPQDAIDDLEAAMTIAVRLTSVPLAMERLVGEGWQGTTVGMATERLPKFPPEMTARFAQWLEQLPLPPPQSEMVLGDKARTLALVDADQKTSAVARAVIRKDIADVYDRMAAIASLPDDQFRGAWAKFYDQDSKSMSKASQMVVLSLGRMRMTDQLILVERKMFAAAVAVQANGPDELKRILDPFDGKPFGYRRTTHGFRLDSISVRGAEDPYWLQIGEPDPVATTTAPSLPMPPGYKFTEP